MSEPTSSGPPTKRAIRQILLSRRDRLTAAERAAASIAIASRAAALIADRLAAGSIVALYDPKGSEVSTGELDSALRDRGLRVAYPRVQHGDRTRVAHRQLAIHEVPRDQLAPGRFGLREPLETAPRIALDDVAAFVVPGIAFDRDGGRIGWGHGYYDATLDAATHALRIGLAYHCQIVEPIAREPHDVLLEIVVTEVETVIARRPE